MAFLPTAKRSMRIIALPLALRTAPTRVHSEHLTYYQFVLPPPSQAKKNSLSLWATTKAADLWAGLGKAPDSSWKRKAFLYGERLIDRLEFEELALKSVDPSLGPKLLPLGRAADAKPRPADHPTIPLVYPPSACTSPLLHLRALLEKRTPRHRQGFIFWLAVSPLTAPFMLIPVIPNFPFFFCIWRSWSHYRAYKASQYLEAFVAQGAVVPAESAELDAIYAEYAPRPPDPSTTPSAAPASPPGNERGPSAPSASAPSSSPPHRDSTAADAQPRLLLTREAVPALARLLAMPPESGFAADVYRALEQARLRLERGAR
ncbi:hypothetical protein AcW1_007886 [Taiwanofungus camphoratus]|nr:hypothetical protein AcW2_007056 [Antrodia cinnamomea]KAI0953740.1 hypothetical protein AcW1_007886 [Antrodia cinnamomea]